MYYAVHPVQFIVLFPHFILIYPPFIHFFPIFLLNPKNILIFAPSYDGNAPSEA